MGCNTCTYTAVRSIHVVLAGCRTVQVSDWCRKRVWRQSGISCTYNARHAVSDCYIAVHLLRALFICQQRHLAHNLRTFLVAPQSHTSARVGGVLRQRAGVLIAHVVV